MKICVITPYFHPHSGGSEQYIESLYSNLMALDSSIQVDVICYNTSSQPAIEKYRNFQIYRIPAWEILADQFALPNYWELRKLIKKLKTQAVKYDVVNSHTRFFDNSWWTPWFAAQFGAKTILTDHCASQPKTANPIINAITWLVDHWLFPLIASKYDLITVESRATGQYLEKLALVKSEIILPGIQEAKKSPIIDKTDDQQFLRKELHLQPEDLVITFVGRLISSKGIALFLQTAESLQKELKNVHWVVIGEGPEYGRAQTFQSSNIHILGKLPHSQVATALQETDILIHPSSHHDGIPLVLLEAGAAGCAVIASKSGGSQEVIIDQETGLICKLKVKDIVRLTNQLINNTQLRRSLGKNLQLHLKENFNWTTSASQFFEIIKKLKN